MEPNKCNSTHHDLLEELLETKCLHRYRPLAISTKVQNPPSTRARTWIHTNLGLHKKGNVFVKLRQKGEVGEPWKWHWRKHRRSQRFWGWKEQLPRRRRRRWSEAGTLGSGGRRNRLGLRTRIRE